MTPRLALSLYFLESYVFIICLHNYTAVLLCLSVSVADGGGEGGGGVG